MPFIASMGIYVLKASAIKELLTEHFPSQHDFGSDIIPGAKDLGYHVQAYLYDGYWEDIGTIEAFYRSNLALTQDPDPDFRCAVQSGCCMIHYSSEYGPSSHLTAVG